VTWRKLQERVAAQPAVTAIVLYAVVAIGAFLTAYFHIFSEFAAYDDEGTLLVTVNAFVHGDALYRDIWSVYGPFYYELFGGFFKLFGISVTTEASRTIVLFVWIGASLLFGLAAQRLTGRLAIGLTTMIAAFAALAVLANEPMHPEGLCALLLAGFAFCAVSGLRERVGWSGLACGALLAALLLTKVNLGIFAIAGTVAAGALTIGPIYRIRPLRWLIVLAFLAMPLVVLAPDLKMFWVRELGLLEALAAISVLVAAQTVSAGRAGTDAEGDAGMLRWAIRAVVGFVVAFVAIIVIVLLTGPSASDVYRGVVTDALEIHNVLTSQFPFPSGSAIDWGIAAVVAAVLAAWVRLTRPGARPALWTGLLRAAVGLVILCSIAHITPLALPPAAENPVVRPMLLVWVAVIPPLGVVESAYKRFLRVLLPLVAIAETLQVYPVPGSQVGIASVTFVIVGALCLSDALVDLRAWSEARGGVAVPNLGAAVAVLTIAVPAMFGLNSIVLAGLSNAVTYHEQPKLGLPGTGPMRLPETQVAEYVGLVDALHEHHCSTFIGWPNVNSLYLWSGLEPPRPSVPNGWFYAATEDQQNLAVAELKAAERPCAIVNEELAAGSYLKGEPAPPTSLVHYVEHNFEPVATIGASVLELPKPSATQGG
jgi:hypothetical protein